MTCRRSRCIRGVAAVHPLGPFLAVHSSHGAGAALSLHDRGASLGVGGTQQRRSQGRKAGGPAEAEEVADDVVSLVSLSSSSSLFSQRESGASALPVPTPAVANPVPDAMRLLEQNNRIELSNSGESVRRRLFPDARKPAPEEPIRKQVLLATLRTAAGALLHGSGGAGRSVAQPRGAEAGGRVPCWRVVYELFAFKPLFTRLSLEWYVKGSPLNALEVLPEPVKVRIWVCVDSSPSFR